LRAIAASKTAAGSGLSRIGNHSTLFFVLFGTLCLLPVEFKDNQSVPVPAGDTYQDLSIAEAAKDGVKFAPDVPTDRVHGHFQQQLHPLPRITRSKSTSKSAKKVSHQPKSLFWGSRVVGCFQAKSRRCTGPRTAFVQQAQFF
jgi:hypothetical protein